MKETDYLVMHRRVHNVSENKYTYVPARARSRSEVIYSLEADATCALCTRAFASLASSCEMANGTHIYVFVLCAHSSAHNSSLCSLFASIPIRTRHSSISFVLRAPQHQHTKVHRAQFPAMVCQTRKIAGKSSPRHARRLFTFVVRRETSLAQ